MPGVEKMERTQQIENMICAYYCSTELIWLELNVLETNNNTKNSLHFTEEKEEEEEVKIASHKTGQIVNLI